MRTIEFFATHPVFTHGEFLSSRQALADRSPRTADSLLRKHLARGRIVRVRRGLYASVPIGADAGKLRVDPYLLASKVTDDAIVGYHAALQFHGRSYSIWNQVTFLTRRTVRPFTFGGTDFVPVRPRHTVADLPAMGGGVALQPYAGAHVRVATCERAMVDILDAPERCGGWEEIWRSLEMVEFFDLDAVITYTLALRSALTTARVGFFLEQHRESLFVEERHLELLEQHAPRQTRYLDRSREPGRLIKRWRLVIPEQVLERRWDEVP
jgi:predicted transcriptional regulator of viral defense system